MELYGAKKSPDDKMKYSNVHLSISMGNVGHESIAVEVL